MSALGIILVYFPYYNIDLLCEEDDTIFHT